MLNRKTISFEFLNTVERKVSIELMGTLRYVREGNIELFTDELKATLKGIGLPVVNSRLLQAIKTGGVEFVLRRLLEEAKLLESGKLQMPYEGFGVESIAILIKRQFANNETPLGTISSDLFPFGIWNALIAGEWIEGIRLGRGENVGVNGRILPKFKVFFSHAEFISERKLYFLTESEKEKVYLMLVKAKACAVLSIPYNSSFEMAWSAFRILADLLKETDREAYNILRENTINVMKFSPFDCDESKWNSLRTFTS